MDPESAPIPTGSNHLMNRSASGGGLLHEREVVRSAGRDAISSFLDSHTCFSVLRASGKCVVFDTRIPIQLAFYALVEHGKCLPAFLPCLLLASSWETCCLLTVFDVEDFYILRLSVLL
jgi:hypothetical protein